MSLFEANDGVGRLTVATNTAIGVLAGATGVTVSHKQIGAVVKTTLTLASTPQSVVNGVEYQGTKLWDFPKGDIVILASELSLAQKTTSVIADTLNASSTGAVAVGTAAASNVALTSTMADIVDSTAFVSSATINVAGTAVTNDLDYVATGTLTVQDGNTTAIPVYLNSAFATTEDVDADATMTWIGTIAITWLYLGGVQGLVG